jgi:hypothetical protein
LAVLGSQFTVAFLPRPGSNSEDPKTMNGTKKITTWIQWSNEDGAFSGYLPALEADFTAGTEL